MKNKITVGIFRLEDGKALVENQVLNKETLKMAKLIADDRFYSVYVATKNNIITIINPMSTNTQLSVSVFPHKKDMQGG